MIILGIETSCDETAAAIIKIKNQKIKILANTISSQIDIHKEWGGVIPEVAAREHVLNILPVIDEALRKAKIKKEKINAIAVNYGPGLITSLMTGVETAKTLSYAWGIPLIATNHIESHIYANFLNEKKIKFPALILTVSGGHNMLILMKGHGQYKIIGETRDDAGGEAFDKAAQLLGLGYPGGPVVAAQAAKLKLSLRAKKVKPCLSAGRNSDTKATATGSSRQPTSRLPQNDIVLPRPMLNSKSYDFSFSGLKTALLYAIKKDKNYKKRIPEYCHEFQQAVIDVLIHKTLRAAEEYKVKSIMLAGGVSANIELRAQLEKAVKKLSPPPFYLSPKINLTTDNAVMAAIAGCYKARAKKFTPWQKIKADCNAKL